MKKKLFYIACGILLLIICFGATSINAKSMSDKDASLKRNYYDEEESVYRERVEAVLNAYGLYHSGISMTSVTDENGLRNYKVKINNRYAAALDDADFINLMEELDGLLFADGMCAVSHELR